MSRVIPENLYTLLIGSLLVLRQIRSINQYYDKVLKGILSTTIKPFVTAKSGIGRGLVGLVTIVPDQTVTQMYINNERMVIYISRVMKRYMRPGIRQVSDQLQ